MRELCMNQGRADVDRRWVEGWEYGRIYNKKNKLVVIIKNSN